MEVMPHTDRSRYARYDIAPDPHLMDFLQVFARYKWTVVFLVLAVGFGSFAITYFMPQGYETRAVILPPDRNSSADLLSRFNAVGALKMLKAVENPSVDLLQNILESREAASHIAQDSTIRNYYDTYVRNTGEFTDALSWVRATIRIEPGITHVFVNSELYTSWSSSPKERDDTRHVIARIANIATDEVQQFLWTSLSSGAHMSRLYAEEEYASNLHELDSLDLIRQGLEEKHKVFALPQQVQSLITNRAALAAQLSEYRIKSETELKELTSTSPQVEELQAKIAGATSAMEEFDHANPVGPAFDALPEVSRQYASLKMKIAELEPIVTYLRQEVVQEKINEQRDKKIIQVIDPATVPLRKSSPKRLVMLLLGLTAGLALSVVYVAGRSFFERARPRRREAVPSLERETLFPAMGEA